MRERKKALLHAHLPQTKGQPIAKLYTNFRKRVRKKSTDAFVDNCKNPVRLIININHPVMDTQESVLVEHNSFKPINNVSGTEIGFEAIVYSTVAGPKRSFLKFFKSGKGYTEEIGQ